MKDLPTQINLAQCNETEIDVLGTWPHLNLAKGMALSPALDTALSSLSWAPPN